MQNMLQRSISTSPMEKIMDSKRDEVSKALAKAGLASSNVILGIDFTISNEWTGKTSFNERSLHHIGVAQNPYEQAISLFGRILPGFDADKLISCFGFGDASTHDQDVFSFYPDERPCRGIQEVLTRYREIVPHLNLAGPTSFAPIIEMVTTIVKQSVGKHHVLLIIADGQVTRSADTECGRLSWQEQKTVDAIIKASEYPLSIILVGVGAMPWGMLKQYYDHIPSHAFRCFQFVNFTKIMSQDVPLSIKEAEFAVAAFVGVLNYKHNLSGFRYNQSSDRVSLPPPLHSAASCTSKPTVAETVSDRNPIQRAETPNTGTGQRSAVDNGSGPLFEALEGEREISRTGAWEGYISIGNFPIPEKFAALYRRIWQKHGHLATRNVVKTSTFILVAAVSELLKSITVMETVKRVDVDGSLLAKWDAQIADAEALQFRVGWLRKHFNEVRKNTNAASLKNSCAALEKALTSVLQRQSAACAKRDALKVQLAEAEQEVEQLKLEVIQQRQEKQYMSSLFYKTFLQDAI